MGTAAGIILAVAMVAHMRREFRRMAQRRKMVRNLSR